MVSQRSLTMYADNCGGQNKNNTVLKYLLWLTDCKQFKEINLVFLVKGHTKNACDRGFAHIRRRLERQSAWTLDQLCNVADDAASSSVCHRVEGDDFQFFDFKQCFSNMYKDLKSIQKYQLFRFDSAKPGTVECRLHLSSPVDVQDLLGRRRTVAIGVLDNLAVVPKPPVNDEKICEMYRKIRPFVPNEFKDDDLYREPTEENIKKSRDGKQQRRKAVTSTVELDEVVAEDVEIA
ncbi:hypothetical protein Ae201684P_020436 [Aphanomyces euteiches]|nr:hypothetical protein Ae201684P_020436 [Aphanomyces euteiches]KAH9152014.1 hypothetical protein AeRB84_005502 [Aphanomyces euteiches]